MTSPNRLREYMVRADISPTALAKAAGTTRQTIHKLQRGEIKLSLEWAERLGKILNVPWPELMGFTPPQRKETKRHRHPRSTPQMADNPETEQILQSLAAIRDDVAVSTDNADLAKMMANHTRSEIRTLSEIVTTMRKQIQKLQDDVRQLKGEP
jgi:DNA-binding XRE family transcriptional regulator